MVIITTRDTHRLATCSEKELGIGGVAPDSFPIDAFGGDETREGRGRLKEQPACMQVPRILPGRCAIPLPLPSSPGAALTWDLPPAPSTARVTERAQQMTWILKKEPKKLLQPRAIISCGGRGRIGWWRWRGRVAGHGANLVGHASWILGLGPDLLLHSQTLPIKKRSAPGVRDPYPSVGQPSSPQTRAWRYLLPGLGGPWPILLLLARGSQTYLVRIHVIAMLASQGPTHSQVDDVAHDGQGEGCANHVLPL